MSPYIFELEMQVRDYECDMEGIVNNANYQHYLEHTRHEFLAASGIPFIENVIDYATDKEKTKNKYI